MKNNSYFFSLSLDVEPFVFRVWHFFLFLKQTCKKFKPLLSAIETEHLAVAVNNKKNKIKSIITLWVHNDNTADTNLTKRKAFLILYGLYGTILAWTSSAKHINVLTHRKNSNVENRNSFCFNVCRLTILFRAPT